MPYIQMKIPQFRSVNEILGKEKPSWKVVSDSLKKLIIILSSCHYYYPLG